MNLTTLLANNSPALIPVLLLATGMLLPLVSMKKRTLAWPVAMIASSVTTAISIYNVFVVMEKGPVHYIMGGWFRPIGIEYTLDHLSAFVMLVINSVAFLVLIHAKKIVSHELPGKEAPYYGAVILMLCGFNGIVVTGDLFNLYVFLEICSLALYGLIAVGEKKAPFAAFRYLMMGAMGATFYLMGVGFLYMTTGSLNMADTRAILPHVMDKPAVLVAIGLMVLGMGIKMALFPLHHWLPDAYTYAPSTSSAIIAPTGTKVAAYVLLRVMYFVFGITFVSRTLPIANIITWLAAIAIIYGSVMAIAQKEMKRMLAFSSVAQIGYIALGIGLANALALVGAVLHVLNHAVMKSTLFLVAGNMRMKLGHSNISRMNHTIRKKMPWTMAAFTVAALSMVGLPPLGGFFSKWYLALGAVNNGKWSGWVFLAVILISSLLNAVYFFRIVEKVYMKPIDGDKSRENEGEAVAREEVPGMMLVPTLIMAAAIIVLGLTSAYIVKGVLTYIVPPAGM